FSALNIPHMSAIIRHHGLVPVPADLDPHTLAPDLGALTRAITQRTRAVLIAQLYGSLTPLDAVAALARARNLLLIEDCAQGYDGVYVGHPEADVSLFSFGPVKTAAALAGAVLRARDADLAARLRASQETWPTQCRWDYAKRLGQFAALKALS